MTRHWITSFLLLNTKCSITKKQAQDKPHFVIPAQAGIQYIHLMKAGFVYILASQKNGTLYIGVTSDLLKRIYEHKQGLVDGFTRKYGVKTLVYYESHDDIGNAIHRETQMKKWNRLWKLRLIEENNPDWQDLYEGIGA